MSGAERNGARRWDEDPRITAYALDELEPAERAEVEALLAEEPAARERVAELRALSGELASALEEELACGGAPLLSPGARRAIAERAAEGGPRSARRWRRVAASVVALAGLGLAAAVGIDALKGSADLEVAGRAQPAADAARPGETIEYRRAAPGAESPDSGFLYDEDGDAQFVGRTRGYLEDRLGSLEAPESSGEGYASVPENPFRFAAVEPLSTFSVDVDTASYANVRRFLRDGTLPPPDAVRIEELVNYFPYDYALPRGEHPFAVDVEVGAAPWAPRHRLLRVGLRSTPLDRADRRPSNLVFLLDVSGSMDDARKLPLVKRSLRLLVEELDARDRVAIVVYAGAAGVVLEPTAGDLDLAILGALERLDAGGSTNGGEGIELAYRLAREGFLEDGNNRVVLATDGDFNVGPSDVGALEELIADQAASGVFLTVLGFGTGNLQDAKMEALADRGNGHYAYVDSLAEARKVLVGEVGASLETVAKDVKIQVEFDPGAVLAYRLIGYENRMLAAEDFADDEKDAGEIGAGHRVTALYELVPAGEGLEVPGRDADAPPAERSPSAGPGGLGALRLRYKTPTGTRSRLLERTLSDSLAAYGELSDDTRFAAAVAAWGMLLRGSSYAGDARWSDVASWAAAALGDDPGGYRAELHALALEAQRLAAERDAAEGEAPR